MRLIIALLFAAALAAQTVSLTGPQTVKPGRAFDVQVQVAGSTAAGPAALQWTLVPSTGVSITAITPGAALTAAGKDQFSCVPLLAPDTSHRMCLAYGVNQNVVEPGVVARASLTASPTQGMMSVALAGVVAADKVGETMNPTTGPPLTVRVTFADVNGDGVIDAADISAMATQTKPGAVCADDQNGDGRCNVIDVFIVVLRSMGI